MIGQKDKQGHKAIEKGHPDPAVKKFQEHKENIETLSGRNCRHNFYEKKNPKGHLTFRCRKCKGEVDSNSYYWYVLGRSHG